MYGILVGDISGTGDGSGGVDGNARGAYSVPGTPPDSYEDGPFGECIGSAESLVGRVSPKQKKNSMTI